MLSDKITQVTIGQPPSLIFSFVRPYFLSFVFFMVPIVLAYSLRTHETNRRHRVRLPAAAVGRPRRRAARCLAGVSRRCEQLQRAIDAHGTENAYFLYNTRCVYRLANSDVENMLRFSFDGTVLTDRSDAKPTGPTWRSSCRRKPAARCRRKCWHGFAASSRERCSSSSTTSLPPAAWPQRVNDLGTVD